MSIIFAPAGEALNKQDRSKLIAKFQTTLAQRVAAAYIFGSFAVNRHDQFSDIDMILVVDIDLPFFERPKRFFDLHDIWESIDMLVYTPSEFKSQLARASEGGFWHSVQESLVRIV